MSQFNIQYFQTKIPEISELKPDNFTKNDYDTLQRSNNTNVHKSIRQMRWKSFTHFHKTILFFDDGVANPNNYLHAIYTGIRNSTKIKRYQPGNPPILQDVNISSISFGALKRLKIYIEIQRIRTKNPRFAEIIYKSIVGQLLQYSQQQKPQQQLRQRQQLQQQQLQQQQLQQQQWEQQQWEQQQPLLSSSFGRSEIPIRT
jgi:hypothetical protein